MNPLEEDDPMRRLYYSPKKLLGFPGVVVCNSDGTQVPFDPADKAHALYEVKECLLGSWWVPVSTHPPKQWKNRIRVRGTGDVNHTRQQVRPSNIYIWIPESVLVLNDINPGDCRGEVKDVHPPKGPPGA
jgi:hypothetical protein